MDSPSSVADIMPQLLDMSKMERCLGGHSDTQYRRAAFISKSSAVEDFMLVTGQICEQNTHFIPPVFIEGCVQHPVLYRKTLYPGPM